MSTRCGLWIDHRDAHLVFLDGEEVTVRNLESGVESVRPGGGSPGVTARGRARSRPGGRTAGPQDAVPEDRLQRKRDQDLEAFYREVADAVRDADLLFVAGPGEAKDEFARLLVAEPNRRVRLIGVESAQRMTEAQWVARVRDAYDVAAPRVSSAAPGTPLD